MSPVAGPIVRRVTPTSATVWIVLPRRATVTLRVESEGRPVARGARATVRLLDDVHVVAVTAPGAFAWGMAYSYRLFADDVELDLSAFALDGRRPGFRLFAPDLLSLRFAHGSCRKLADTVGPDALDLVEVLLNEKDPPQALFLTGDQVYADDVAPTVLDTLDPRPIADRASHVARAGFTTTESRCHLVELEEYARMYIAAWTTSPQVRRSLANVATWMMFDDHDVTDDWNLDRAWVEGLRDEGRRIVRNALTAYALFQHWGNAPEEVEACGFLDDLDPSRIPRWGWEITTPLFRCVALDTRTRRQFGAPDDRPGLVTAADAHATLPDPQAPFTLVVSPAPVLGQRLVEWLQEKDRALHGNYASDQEAWSGHPGAYTTLLDRLAAQRHALVLSGDVHFGFASRLTGPGWEIVNLTSSPLRNVTAAAKALTYLNWRARVEVQTGLVTQVRGEPAVEELVATEAPELEGLQAAHRSTRIVATNHVCDVRFLPGRVKQRYVSPGVPPDRWVSHSAWFLPVEGLQAPAQEVRLAGSRDAARAAARSFGADLAGADPAVVTNVLKALRDQLLPEEVVVLADAAEAVGSLSTRGRVLRGQALIDLGRLTEAIAALTALPEEDDFVRGERAGLLGRAYKQLWADARPNAAEPRLGDLDQALRWYGAVQGSEDDEWLLVNRMALLAARRSPEAAPLAARIRGCPDDPKNPWQPANRMEAALVLGEVEEAQERLAEYLDHPEITAFHARGTLRQLVQVYGLDAATHPGSALIPYLEAAVLSRGGTGELIDFSPQRRLPDQGTFLPLEFLRRGLEVARSVVRLEVDGRGVGTGFLVDLSAARPRWRRVLLTNAHVCSKPLRHALARRPETVAARFADGSLRPVRHRWSCPVHEGDACVLAVADPPAAALVPVPFDPDGATRTLVNLIGHPAGQDAQVSAQDNDLVMVDRQYLRYRARTAGGSSGSPVFDNEWGLVGLHHARNELHHLNEGVRLSWIVEVLRRGA